LRSEKHILGGASGIGLATVKEFAREGASVAVFDLNEVAGREQVDGLKREGLAVQFFHVDVTSPEQIQKAVAAFGEQNHGQIHHIVNGGLFFAC
jgi:NAD(P)-dependent dehydrogenase (short-subunit alcohol dehydrogenase family)